MILYTYKTEVSNTNRYDERIKKISKTLKRNEAVNFVLQVYTSLSRKLDVVTFSTIYIRNESRRIKQ